VAGIFMRFPRNQERGRATLPAPMMPCSDGKRLPRLARSGEHVLTQPT
jgi:hypothetical protein